MKFGYFDDRNKEYVITTPQTPLPWINYLGSEDFFSLVSNTAGGYSFYRDARMRRLTRYRYNNSPLDMDGHRIYIKDGDTVWNPGWQPTKTPLDSYSCRHGLGYTVVEGKKDGVTARQELFVPKGDACELDRLTLTNRSDRPRELDVFGYVEFCLWDAVDDSTNFQRNFSTGEVEVEPGVIYHKTEYRERRDHYAMFWSNTPVTSFDTTRDAFCGVYGGPAECFVFLPVRKMDGALVSEFDGYSVDEIGLLKEDVLATKELAKLSAVIALVNRNFGQELTIGRITQDMLEDGKTYRLLSDGNTQNVFQFSSPGITRFIQDVQPECIEDLIAINALYRPATLDIGATDDYVRFRRGEVAPVYNYGCYEATKNTFGIMVYQEQFMSVAHTLGGFDLGKTDYLRKAIGKKKADLMATLKADFIAGAVGNGCPDYEAEEIWHKIEVAGKYSFNRSHAAAYALTAYCGAWLKANYPSAFYTVALQWADDKEIPSLMAEMERCSSAKIVPPDINRSGTEFFTDYATDEIFWSLTRIKQVGVKTVEYIVTERDRGGAYTGIENFIHRIFRYKLKKYSYWDDPDNAEEAVKVPVNARHVKHMILAGCFDRIEKVGAVTERCALLERAARELGFSLSEKDFPQDMRGRHFFWSQQQIAVSGIGSIDYRRIFNNSEARRQVKGKASYLTLDEVARDENDGRRATVCATVVDVTEHTYKDRETGSRKRFAKLTLSQNNRLAECVCWNDYYMEHHTVIQSLKDRVVILTAVIRYSDYNGCNTLQTYRNSLLFIQS